MMHSCARRCAATLRSTTSSAYIRPYATFLRPPSSGSVACNHVSTKAVQDPPPVRAFYLVNAGGGGPVNLVSLGPQLEQPYDSIHARYRYFGLHLSICARPF